MLQSDQHTLSTQKYEYSPVWQSDQHTLSTQKYEYSPVWQSDQHTFVTNLKQNEAQSACAESTDVPLVEFMYLVFTRIPGESHIRRLRSLLLSLYYVF